MSNTASGNRQTLKFTKKNGESLFKDHKEVPSNQAKGREYLNSLYSGNYWFKNSNSEQGTPSLPGGHDN